MKILAQKGMYIFIFYFFWTFSALDYTGIAVLGCWQWDEQTVRDLLVLWKPLDRITYQLHKKVHSDSHLFSPLHCSRSCTESWPSSSFGGLVLSFPVSFWSPKACVLCLNLFPALSIFPSFFWLSWLVPIAPDYPQLFSACPVFLCFPALCAPHLCSVS